MIKLILIQVEKDYFIIAILEFVIIFHFMFKIINKNLYAKNNFDEVSKI